MELLRVIFDFDINKLRERKKERRKVRRVDRLII